MIEVCGPHILTFIACVFLFCFGFLGVLPHTTPGFLQVSTTGGAKAPSAAEVRKLCLCVEVGVRKL